MRIIELERLSQQLKPFKLLEHCWCIQALVACFKAPPFFNLLAKVYAGKNFPVRINWQARICLYSKTCVCRARCLLCFFQWDHVYLCDRLAWVDGLCGGFFFLALRKQKHWNTLCVIARTVGKPNLESLGAHWFVS